MPVRTVIERGPRDRKAVAFAVDWPGWSRGARTADGALATLEAYRARYRPVAVGAGLGAEFDAAGTLAIVEERVGTGSTDFWGISYVPTSFEREPMDREGLERRIALLRACWAYFDDVAARVSPEMRKGPGAAGAIATGSSPTPSGPRARSSRSSWGCGSPNAPRSPRTACGRTVRRTSMRSAPTSAAR